MHRSCLGWHRALQAWGAASTLLEPSCFLPQTTLPGAACCGLLAPVTGESIWGSQATLPTGPPGSSAASISLGASLIPAPAPGMASSGLCRLLTSHLVVEVQISMSPPVIFSTRNLLRWLFGSSPRLWGPMTVSAWCRVSPGQGDRPSGAYSEISQRLCAGKFQMCFSSTVSSAALAPSLAAPPGQHFASEFPGVLHLGLRRADPITWRQDQAHVNTFHGLTWHCSPGLFPRVSTPLRLRHRPRCMQGTPSYLPGPSLLRNNRHPSL